MPRDWAWRAQPDRAHAYWHALRAEPLAVRFRLLLRLIWPPDDVALASARRAGEPSASATRARLRRIRRGAREWLRRSSTGDPEGPSNDPAGEAGEIRPSLPCVETPRRTPWNRPAARLLLPLTAVPEAFRGPRPSTGLTPAPCSRGGSGQPRGRVRVVTASSHRPPVALSDPVRCVPDASTGIGLRLPQREGLHVHDRRPRRALMARCLVIGANGFLGSRLTDALVEAGHEVTGFDRFSRGTRSFASSTVRIVAGDFLSTSDLAAAVDGHDVVFHFLSTTTPATADGDPTLDLRTNVSQSVELLALCARAGVGRVFYASSGGAIYGPQTLPVFSETAPLAPLSPYGIGKLIVERYLDYYAATEGLASVSLRISNPYGANANPSKRQGIIPITLNRIQRGEPVVQVGDGSMVRDYIHVDDLVRRILRMVETEPRERAYNLGSGARALGARGPRGRSTRGGARLPVHVVPKPRPSSTTWCSTSVGSSTSSATTTTFHSPRASHARGRRWG